MYEVFIPFLHNVKFVKRCVWSCLSQTVPPSKVHVWWFSDVKPPEFPSNVILHFARREEFDHGRPKNEFLSICKEKFALFLTADVFLERDAVRKLIEASEGYAGVWGRQVLWPRFWDDYFFVFRFPDFSFAVEDTFAFVVRSPLSVVSTPFLLLKKSFFEGWDKVFPENTVIGEDLYFQIKAILSGLRFFYRADAIAYHENDTSCRYSVGRGFDTAVTLLHFERFKGYFGNLWGKAYATLRLSMLFGALNSAFGYSKLIARHKGKVRNLFRFISRTFGYSSAPLVSKIPSLAKRFSNNPIYWERLRERNF